MQKNIVKRSVTALVYLLGIFLIPFTAFAQWNVGTPPGNLPSSDLPQIITNITTWVLGFVTGLSVLILIWGGILYVTASADENQMEDARNVIRYALWGLVIVGISYAIVNVVVSCWIGGSAC